MSHGNAGSHAEAKEIAREEIDRRASEAQERRHRAWEEALSKRPAASRLHGCHGADGVGVEGLGLRMAENSEVEGNKSWLRENGYWWSVKWDWIQFVATAYKHDGGYPEKWHGYRRYEGHGDTESEAVSSLMLSIGVSK